MPRYLVEGCLTISVRKEIEAKSEAQARSKGNSLMTPQLCHQCDEAGCDDDESWELNGFDEDSGSVQTVQRLS